MNSKENIMPLRPRVKCPQCGTLDSNRKAYPFCSDRCRDIDLNRWMNGAYAIPVSEDEQAPSDEEQG